MSTSPERFAVAKFARGCFRGVVVSRESLLCRGGRPSGAARRALARPSSRWKTRCPGQALFGRLLPGRALALFCAILAVFVGLTVAQAAPVHPLLAGGLSGALPGAGQAHVSGSGSTTVGHRNRALPAEAECEPLDDAESEDSAAPHPLVALAATPQARRLFLCVSAGSPPRVNAAVGPSSFWIGARPARGPPLLG
jgi:hypothetical protein